jgi:hypothetical protein
VKRLALYVVVGALLVIMIPGVGSAATGTCPGTPCSGTNSADTIFERLGRGVPDVIRGLGGGDTIHAEDFTSDQDRLFGGPGNDRLDTRDNDSRDFVNCGPGNHDVAIVDKGDHVNHTNCESIRRG